MDDAYAIGLGAAAIISYMANESILWAIFHGLLSWLFVLYAAAVY